MEKILIGKVVKPHGIKGEIKIKMETNKVLDFGELSGVFVGENFYKIKRSFLAGGENVLGLDGIDSVVQANELRGKKVFVLADEITKRDEGEVLVEDILGARIVLDNGEEIGELENVENYGASDLFFIKSHNFKNLIVPNIDGLIESYENNVITFNKKKFQEVKSHD